MTIKEQVAEVLNLVDGGPWHWADLDLILLYFNDDYGYDKDDIPAIQEELDKQAYHHIIRVPEVTRKGVARLKTIHVWATRPEIKASDIKKEYLELY